MLLLSLLVSVLVDTKRLLDEIRRPRRVHTVEACILGSDRKSHRLTAARTTSADFTVLVLCCITGYQQGSGLKCLDGSRVSSFASCISLDEANSRVSFF